MEKVFFIVYKKTKLEYHSKILTFLLTQIMLHPQFYFLKMTRLSLGMTKLPTEELPSETISKLWERQKLTIPIYSYMVLKICDNLVRTNNIRREILLFRL